MVFIDIEREDGLIPEEDSRKKFVSWIQAEVEESRNNLEGRHKKLRKYRRNREGIPELETKNTPYPGASNLMVPLTVWMAQTIYASVKNTFSLRDPFWQVRAMYKDAKLIEQARVLTKYLGLIADSPTDLDLRNKNRTIIYDATSLGTCFVKFPWMKRSWKINQPDGEVIEATSHDGVAVVPYPEEDVLYPVGAENLQESPWVCFIEHLYEHELLQLQDAGIYQGVDEILGGYGDNGETRENIRKQARDMGYEESYNSGLYDIAEVYAFYDVEGNGVPQDVIVTIHLPTGIVLREEYNTIGRRPMGVFKYMHVPYQMGGRGVGQMAEHLQDEMDTTHNMRIDHNRYAMQPMIKVLRGSGVKPNEKLMLGKIIQVDGMDDFMPFQLAKLEYASVTEENLAMSYAQRATGVSEIMAGMADSTLKSRDTLGGQMLRLQQGKGMYGAVIESIEAAFSDMGQTMFYMFAHKRQEIIEKESRLGRMSAEDISLLNDALSIPLNELPLKLNFSVRTRNIEDTKDVQRNNLLMLKQLQSQHTQEIAQALMMVNNTQMPVPEVVRDAIMKGVEGSSRIMVELLELVNFDNTDEYVISGDTYENMERQRKAQMLMQQFQQQIAAQQQMAAMQGGVNGTSNAGLLPGAAPEGAAGTGEAGGIDQRGEGVLPQG